ncbi:MAG: low molecular weight protein arginine phosphatase [Elusimicrobia bacterium]|nr:low molecular weight protein arginine phosphatase [Elusimicrobiota bacterium]
MKALFVCTGNTCRSVMAQYLFADEAKRRGLSDWEAKSAGLAAERYFAVPSGVAKALAPRGLSPDGHVAQLATRELLRWADLVLPMTRGHRDALWDEYPEFRHKTTLFLEACGLGSQDVSDPIGQPDAVYLRCRDIIEQGVVALVNKHAPSTADPRP